MPPRPRPTAAGAPRPRSAGSVRHPSGWRRPGGPTVIDTDQSIRESRYSTSTCSPSVASVASNREDGPTAMTVSVHSPPSSCVDHPITPDVSLSTLTSTGWVHVLGVSIGPGSSLAAITRSTARVLPSQVPSTVSASDVHRVPIDSSTTPSSSACAHRQFISGMSPPAGGSASRRPVEATIGPCSGVSMTTPVAENLPPVSSAASSLPDPATRTRTTTPAATITTTMARRTRLGRVSTDSPQRRCDHPEESGRIQSKYRPPRCRLRTSGAQRDRACRRRTTRTSHRCRHP